jgi:hypothetical protein
MCQGTIKEKFQEKFRLYRREQKIAQSIYFEEKIALDPFPHVDKRECNS